MILASIAFVVGVVVGAFSHKWLEVEFVKETGVDPQAAANEAKSVVQKLKPKA